LDPTPGTFAGYKSAANSVKVRAMDAAVAGDMANAAGWVMDWYAPGGGVISAGQPSEKVFTAATLRSSVVPTVVVSSSIASTGTCVTSGAGYLNAFDAYHGGSLVGTSYFDINRNGSSTDEKPNLVNKFITSIDFGIGAIGQAGFAGSNVIVQGSGVKLLGIPPTRAMWGRRLALWSPAAHPGAKLPTEPGPCAVRGARAVGTRSGAFFTHVTRRSRCGQTTGIPRAFC